MKLHVFVALLVIAATHLATSSGIALAANRNVVLLVSDNQNRDDCGCYGNAVVKTPNLDQLAREGVRFLDAVATTASCGPSRAVIYSGLQTHTNGQYGHGHGIHTFGLSPQVKTIFSLLQAGGYQTALLGKQHTTPAAAYPFTFTQKVSGRDVGKLAKTAKEFIQHSGDDSFFLTIGYNDPHPTSRDRPGWGVVRKDKSIPVVDYDPDDMIVPDYLPDRPEVREGLAGYYQQISQLDHGIGLVMQVLKETGKEKDTLVIFTSDHGSSEPGAMGNHYEPGIQIPLIVRHPDGVGKGTTNNAMVTLADLMPTILEWTELEGPKYPLQGRSFLSILGDPEPAGWDEVFLSHVCHEVTMYYPMRTYRNRRFKLIWNLNWRSEYPLPIDTLQRATWTETIRRNDPLIGRRTVMKYLHRDPVELYDLANDPDEVINLADDPRFASTRRDLSARLTRWLEETDDPWLVRHRLPLAGEPKSADSRQADLDDSSGYVSIFNGKNLDGWQLRRADRGGYKVEGRNLVCPADGGGYLYTENQYDNFSLRFDFRMDKGANNGIAIRSPMVDSKPAYDGMEFQILDNVGYPKSLKPTQYHGSLYDVAAARRGALKPAGEWNTQEIRCLGRRITVIVNDVAILDVDLDDFSDPALLAKHPGLSRTRGHIGLLGHGSRVEFRNLRVKPIAAESEQSFTVVLLPDTQNYAEKYPDTYIAQTLWIRKQRREDNIKFAIHLGDIVQNPTQKVEWVNANQAMRILDGVVPYSVVPGNHDMVVKNRDSTLYNEFFPPNRFAGRPWYGGNMGETNDNNYCFFEAGGLKFMVLSLEFAPRDETLQWAATVTRKHPGHRVIVATHCYMRPNGRDTNCAASYKIAGNSGEQMWQKFIRKQPNIFLVVSGHVLGVGMQTSTNDAGGQVLEMLTDYQGLPNGGDGWLRSLEFVPRENKIHVKTYSPLLDQHNHEEKQSFSLDYQMTKRGQD